MVRGAKRFLRAAMTAGGLLCLTAQPGAARLWLEPAYPDATVGPSQAKGVVIWSHGRSIESEDSEAPSPPYLLALRNAGWDVLRYNRLRSSDTLSNSARALAGFVGDLKRRGYGRVVLAGQSFGAFLSLLAAGASDEVDAVVATAPAAYGSFTDFYDSWRDNGVNLYPLLRGVRTARVALFYFHGDDFDPGGRAEPSRTILSGRGLTHLVVDQPSYLVGHGAAGTGLFVRRFGACLVRFAERAPAADDPPCDESWGRRPSAQLPLAELASPASGSADAPAAASPFLGRWYGFYLNGREVVLSVERIEGGTATAEYLLGPGVVPGQKAERVGRTGRVVGNELVFDEKGRNSLRYVMRPDGKLAATWSSVDGKAKLDAILRRID